MRGLAQAATCAARPWAQPLEYHRDPLKRYRDPFKGTIGF